MLSLPLSSSADGVVSQALQKIVSSVPASTEPTSGEPRLRAQSLAKSAALRSAALSGTMSLPPGPLGLMTVLPDLVSIWRLQQQLVADIAASFGKSALLTPEAMLICLFKHGNSSLTSELLARSGPRILIRRVAESTLRQLLGKIGIRVTQRLAAKGFSRWLPFIGALGVGAYAYYDTSQVAANAIELFSKDLALQLEPPVDDAPATQVPAAATKRKPSAKKSAPRRSAKSANQKPTQNSHRKRRAAK